MGNVALPFNFVADTDAVASEVNANFNAVTAQVNGNIDSANLANGAVTEGKLAGNSVSSSKLQTDSVSTVKIQNSAVTDAKIVTVSTSKITGGLTDGSTADSLHKHNPSSSGGFVFGENSSAVSAGVGSGLLDLTIDTTGITKLLVTATALLELETRSDAGGAVTAELIQNLLIGDPPATNIGALKLLTGGNMVATGSNRIRVMVSLTRLISSPAQTANFKIRLDNMTSVVSAGATILVGLSHERYITAIGFK